MTIISRKVDSLKCINSLFGVVVLLYLINPDLMQVVDCTGLMQVRDQVHQICQN